MTTLRQYYDLNADGILYDHGDGIYLEIVQGNDGRLYVGDHNTPALQTRPLADDTGVTEVVDDWLATID